MNNTNINLTHSKWALQICPRVIVILHSFSYYHVPFGIRINQTFEITSKKKTFKKSEKLLVRFTNVSILNWFHNTNVLREHKSLTKESLTLKYQTLANPFTQYTSQSVHVRVLIRSTHAYNTSICVTNKNHVCKAIKLAYCSVVATSITTLSKLYQIMCCYSIHI